MQTKGRKISPFFKRIKDLLPKLKPKKMLPMSITESQRDRVYQIARKAEIDITIREIEGKWRIERD